MNRFTTILMMLSAMLMLSGCGILGTSMSSRAALAQSGYTPSARAAVDGQPGVVGPQEIIAVNVPAGPFTFKAGVVWDGAVLNWDPFTPQQSYNQTVPYTSMDPCVQ